MYLFSKKPFIFILVLASLLLSGCKEDIRVDHVDTSMKVNVGAALPIGTLSMTLGDLIGTSLDENESISIDSETGEIVLSTEYNTTFSIKPFDLADEIEPEGNKQFLIVENSIFSTPAIEGFNKAREEANQLIQQLEGMINGTTIMNRQQAAAAMSITAEQLQQIETLADQPEAHTVNDIPTNLFNQFAKLGGDGQQRLLQFPLNLSLPRDADIRIDEAWIRDAEFFSTIHNNFDLQWEVIDSITIELKEAFDCGMNRNVQRIYTKGIDPNYGFGHEFPIDIQEFKLNFIRDGYSITDESTDEQIRSHMLDSAKLNVNFYITLPQNDTIEFNKYSKIDYSMRVELIDYGYLKGWISNDKLKDFAHDTIIRMEDVVSGWSDFADFKIPFASPQLDLALTTEIAGNLQVQLNSLYTEDKNGTRKNANFLGQTSHIYSFEAKQLLNPITSLLGETATLPIHLDEKPENGQIDNLFKLKVDKIGIGMGLLLDKDKPFIPQIRIPSETELGLGLKFKTPFTFSDSVGIHYADTLKDIDLSTIDLDSLAEVAEWLEAIRDAKLLLGITYTNKLQIDLSATLAFLDAEGNDTGFRLNKDTGNAIVLKGCGTSEGIDISMMDKNDWELFTKTKQIVIDVNIDSNTWQSQNPGKVLEIRSTDSFELDIVLAASLEAIVNFVKKQ